MYIHVHTYMHAYNYTDLQFSFNKMFQSFHLIWSIINKRTNFKFTDHERRLEYRHLTVNKISNCTTYLILYSKKTTSCTIKILYHDCNLFSSLITVNLVNYN